MPQLFGRDWTRDELLDHVGDMSQLAGARRSDTVSGPEAGAGFIEMWNSSGLCLTLLPGRCLDIAYAHYRGMPLCFRASPGDVGPAFYEPEGQSWLRGWCGGLLATCGLTFLGHPETDPEEEDEEIGLHGRISYAPAREVVAEGAWEGDDYVVRVRGKMREAIVFGANLELTREIRMRLGEPRFVIHDRVENRSRTVTSPLMLVYHTNPGFPLLDEGSRLVLNSRRTTEWLKDREVGPEEYTTAAAPSAEAHDDVYIHDPVPDAEGYVNVALVNDQLGDGLGLYWRAPKAELPILNQWQHFEAGTYVSGIEPGNCSVLGRARNRASGTLQHIAPGEVREFHLEMGVLDGRDAIAAFERRATGGAA